MLKIIFIVIVTINGFCVMQADDAEELFLVLDSIISSLLPLGNPDTPLVEEGDKIKKICGLINKDFINKQKDKVSSYTKGGTIKLLIQNALDNLSTDKILICQLAKEGGGEKASLMAKEFNRNAVEANKVMLTFLTALHELTQKGTKASLPTLSCYVKKLYEKIVLIYPEKDGVQQFVKSWMDMALNDIFLKTLESVSGKAADNCPMPNTTTNTSKFKSIIIAIVFTIRTLEGK